MEKELVRRGGAPWVAAWTLVVLIFAGLLREGVVTGAVVWGWLIAIVAGVLAGGGAALIAHATGRTKTIIHRGVSAVLAGTWTAYVAAAGWSWTAVIVLAFGAGGALICEWLWAPPIYRLLGKQQAQVEQSHDGDQRPARVRSWEAVLRATFKQPVVVHDVRPWNNAGDGEQVVVELAGELTIDSVIGACRTIATKAKLPPNCAVEVVGFGDHQGIVVLDAMLRDCLAGYREAVEDVTPSSIYDPMPLSRTARGEDVEVTLREKSMLLGGMPGAGKTTLLHRMIMRMARWVDALIWVVDLNGGGVAWPWVEAWARGDAPKPTIDWVATDEESAAVMLAVARAIAKDRKINPEARRRRKAKNTTVLPVDKDLPAIVIVTDEGAEVAQAAGLLGLLVKQGVTRIAQIARAEGIRVVMSILRGTADTVDRSLKVAVAVMCCMRMILPEEYGHVLGVDPKIKGAMPNGYMFVHRPEQDPAPIRTKTDDVTLATIDAHSIATAHLRPDLDERAKKVAARITISDVLDGRDPRDFPDLARHPIMQDVDAGRAYSGRWDRQAHQLAELRGEDVPEFEDEPQRVTVAAQPTVAPPGSVLEKFLVGTNVRTDREQVKPAEPAPVAAPVADGPVAVPAQRPSGDDDAFTALTAPAHFAVDADDPVRPSTDAPQAGADLVPLATAEGHATSARELIRLALRQEGTWLTAADIRKRIRAATGIEVTKQRADQVLDRLVELGEVAKDDSAAKGPYYRLTGQ
ncbi:hypothetical protein [Micromonospora sp. WMMD737]|uniref:hypothetical protein n=1 Tax=Micromonospora sp. WMMD737 TaxID=3404113 RepID=UPI003B959133